EKGHGAADWSRRPLPADWLNYAALDVELLVELRDVLEQELKRQGKLEWAHEEFEAARNAPLSRPRAEPWRRTSGIHRIRNPRQLAAVRALWETRDSVARERDIAPGRVLPDAALVDAAVRNPVDEAALLALPVFRGRAQRRMVGTWLGALQRAAALPRTELPEPSPHHDGPPPANRWSDKDPAAALRLAAVRAALTAIAEANTLPVENLLLPDLVRRTCWQPPEDITPAGVERVLLDGGARRWQVDLTADALAEALQPPPPPTE
ncbi:MAG TPA: HRDC domain-containing protein, partial [Umezawaea sp.]|nr:HRDC domain-containing protein [Umezawaea sp.]